MAKIELPSKEDIRSAVTLTTVPDGAPVLRDPAAGSTCRVARAPGVKMTLPIQFILRELRAAYPEVTFIFTAAHSAAQTAQRAQKPATPAT
jgi:hypothetical protein